MANEAERTIGVARKGRRRIPPKSYAKAVAIDRRPRRIEERLDDIGTEHVAIHPRLERAEAQVSKLKAAQLAMTHTSPSVTIPRHLPKWRGARSAQSDLMLSHKSESLKSSSCNNFVI